MTREEDLVRLATTLDSMVSINTTDGAMDVLKELKNFNMTVQLLQETRIGMSVNGIRKHCSDAEVIALAKFLIKDWKRLLANPSTKLRARRRNETETPQRKPARLTNSRRPESLRIPPPKEEWIAGRKDMRRTPRRGRGVSRSRGGGDTETRTPRRRRRDERRTKADAPQTPTSPTSSMSPGFSPGGPLSPRLATGDTVRDKCIEMLTAALRTDNDFMEFGSNCEQMAKPHIYQEIRATDMKYKNRVRSRISNLKDPKNPGLRRNVLAGYIEMTRIASMSAEEMASDELKQLRNVLTQEAIREHQMAKTGGTSTDLLQCSKCRKKNCTYNQVQTRSADEPMTTFVLCNECGNRWKVRCSLD
ncbi:unnamed protein product [Merluccius merluccius]